MAEVLKDERLYPISQPKVCAVIDALCCQDDDIQIGLRAYRYGRNGFDFDNLPDPTDPANIEKPNGRGVFLMKNRNHNLFHNY